MKIKYLCFSLGLALAGLYLQGQNGFCLKYAGISNGLNNDTLNVFYLNGDSFTQLTKVATGQITYRSLKLKNRPESNFNIFADNTYRMIPDVQIKEYNIKVIGKEKAGNYNCTKIQVSTFVNGAESFMWISDEIPGYQNFIGVSIVDFKTDRLNEGLKKHNIAGIPVKIAYNVQGNLSYELVSAGACVVSPDLLNIDRYTNSKPAATGSDK